MALCTLFMKKHNKCIISPLRGWDGLNCARSSLRIIRPICRRYTRRRVMLRVIAYATVLLSAPVFGYEEYTAPGVGIPVLSFVQSSYTFCKEPNIESDCKNVPVTKGKQFQVFGSDLIIHSIVKTTDPVELIAKEDFTISKQNFENNPLIIHIKKGQNLFKLTPTINEESPFIDVKTLPTKIKINDKVHSIYMQKLRRSVTNFEKQPKTEWWLEVKGKGWFLVTPNNVKYHQRQWAAG